MKIRFNRIISFICAVAMICAVFTCACAEDVPASRTDLSPAEEIIPAEQEPEPAPAEEPEGEPAAEPAEEAKDEVPEEPKDEPAEEPKEDPAEEPVAEPKEEPAEEPVTGVEVVITKTLGIGGSWDGKVGKTKPAVLKLDIKQPCTVHMLVEGRDIWASVEKADHRSDNPPRTQTDPETERTIISWEAEEGSYLITLGPVEPNLLGVAAVTFMDNKAFAAWEEAQEAIEQTENEPEEKPEETPGEEPAPDDENAIPNEDEGSPEEPETPQPERHINVEVTWDVPEPMIGDTAHFKANLEGYDGLTYTMQWQYGPDNETWYDLPGETDTTMDIVVNEENNLYYWRIIVYIEDDQET